MKNQSFIQAILALALLMALLTAMTMGRYTIPATEVFQIISQGMITPEWVEKSNAHTILFKVRLPRIFLAVFTGMSLSVSGAVLQGIFRNPLVDPGIIGVSSGAAFGAVIALLISTSSIMLMTFSFFSGVLALLFTLTIAGNIGMKNILAIILGGIVSAAFFSALVSIVMYVADPRDTLPLIVYWLMGSFNGANSEKLLLLGIIFLISFFLIFKSRYVINILALGDDDASALGVPVARLRMLLLALTTLLTAAAVAVSGTIGWVGLVVPHIARLVTGQDYRGLIVSSALIGGLYMLVADTLVRTSPFGEIPIGILSALVGAPVLAYLLHTRTISGG